jgi:hypothetical protein
VNEAREEGGTQIPPVRKRVMPLPAACHAFDCLIRSSRNASPRHALSMARDASRPIASARSSAAGVRTGSSRTKLGVIFLVMV